MKTLKISHIWFSSLEFEDSIFFHLLKQYANKNIELVAPDKCDILFMGPYDLNTIKRRVYNYGVNKLKNKKINLEFFFPNLDWYSIKRNYKPVKVFLSQESIPINKISADFYITPRIGVSNKNHFRFPAWKEMINWDFEGIKRSNLQQAAQRLGEYYNLDELMRPQGENFLSKEKKFCIITSHLEDPRKSFIEHLSRHFVIDGFGPYFNKKVVNFNQSGFLKKNILEKYAFNLCPENTIFPGYYTEKIPDAFISKSLPVTWADKYVNLDFNPKAFVNLFDYMTNFDEICEMLKDLNFLKKFTKEPLIQKKINLDAERKFIKKIISRI